VSARGISSPREERLGGAIQSCRSSQDSALQFVRPEIAVKTLNPKGKQKMENQVATTNRVSPIRSFAEEGNLGTIGKIVEFKKGQWYVDGEPVDDGKLFIIDMEGGYRCLVKWFDGHPVDGSFQLASIARDEQLPFRNELGDHDEKLWEEGLDGKPRDPWVYGYRQILKAVDGAQLYTFRTSSFGGKKAMQAVYGEYDRERHNHPGCFPVIGLSQEKVRNKTFGLIPEPRFPIRDWRTMDGKPAQIETAPLKEILNDEIPW
jgi:hypothetical protein